MFGRIFRGKRFENDLDEELAAHIAIEVKLLMERGLSREEAFAQARLSFGNRTQVAELTREAWGWEWLERLMQDLRYAARSLRSNHAFTVAAVMSLALGVGSSTAVFSIADTVFLRPLPYTQPDQLLWVANRFPNMNTEFLASPDYVAWRRDNRVFQYLAATQAFGGETMLLNGRDPAEVHTILVSANFLKTFEVQPILGRDFTANEELPDGPKAVLLSHKLWLRRFGGRRDIAGQRVVLDGQQYTVAGVLPQSFVFPMDMNVDLLATLPVSPTASHHDIYVMTWAVYGRLKKGVSIAQARADLERLFVLSKADIPLMFRSDTKLVLEPLHQHRAGDAKMLLTILLGAVTCLLLITCVNVSNLLMGRWSARSGELAVRAAIGAGRGRLARQLFTEAALLTLMGCVFSAVFVVITLHGFVRYASDELPRLSEVTVDMRVAVVGVAVSMLATFVFTTLPVFRAGRVDIQLALQQSSRPGLAIGNQLIKRALVIAEVALSLVLLFGAALLLQTLWHLRNDRLGFQPEHVLTMTIPLKGTKLQNRRRDEVAADLVSFARNIPGTKDAAQTECTPLTTGAEHSTFSRSDRPLPESFHRGDGISVCGTGAGYARAAGIRVFSGRFFSEDDFRYPNTLAVINQRAAAAYFPGENPLGKRIIGGPHDEWKTIIGVVADTKNMGLNAEPQPQAYVNGLTLPDATQLQLIIRSIGDRNLIETALAQKIRSLDPGVVVKFEPLDETIGDMTAGPRFNGMLLASFAGIALLMAVIGIYGLLTFTVTQRTHEIGVRMALGAERIRILGLVFREGSALIFIGVAFGVGGAVALARFLKSVLYGISATDVRTVVLVALGLIAVAMLAMLFPARRAASVDPVEALRHW